MATKRPVQWYTLSDGPPYEGEIPEELSRFYIEFQANWTIGGLGLQEALLQAMAAARRLPTHLDDPPWKGDNTYAFGYVNLLHNQFNTAAAW